MRRSVALDHLELRTGNSVGDLAADPGRSEQILFADNHEGRRPDICQPVERVEGKVCLRLAIVGLWADWVRVARQQADGLLHGLLVAPEGIGEEPRELLAGEHLAGLVSGLHPVPRANRIEGDSRGCRATTA